MDITYQGPCPAVILPGRVKAKRGETVSVSDALGVSLCEQESFVEAKPPAVKKAAPAANKED